MLEMFEHRDFVFLAPAGSGGSPGGALQSGWNSGVMRRMDGAHIRRSLLAAWVVAGLGFGAPPAGATEPRVEADRLVREGAALGEEGRWDEAIARFKEAEKLWPRALHDCNIGLAQARARRPHLGLFYLERCERRETATLPAWVGARQREARAALSRGAFAQIELRVVAAEGGEAVVGAELTVSGLGDETLAAPAQLWLPLGEHTVVARAPGRVETRRALSVGARDRVVVEVALVLEPTVQAEPEPEPDPMPEPEPEPVVVAPPLVATPEDGDSNTPAWVTIGVGGAALAVGGILYGVAAKTGDDASRLPPGAAFDEKLAAFELERGFSYGLLGVGAAAVVVGLGLVLFADGPRATVTPVAGGGAFELRASF